VNDYFCGMSRYFIFLRYNGRRYCGWQSQPNGPTVQQVVEEALATCLRSPVPITGAGRTDAGVHARMMVAHFDRPTPIEQAEAFAVKLNRMLPPDIAIDRILAVKEDAHARFDATARTYHYYISTRKDPFKHELVCRLHTRLDFEAMNEACCLLYEYTDFTSFSKLHTDVKTNNCCVTHAAWTEEEGEGVGVWRLSITADRFLRNMVRAIVGTLFEVGRGKLSLTDFRRIIEAKDRGRAGSSVPAHALFLDHITYPPHIFIDEL